MSIKEIFILFYNWCDITSVLKAAKRAGACRKSAINYYKKNKRVCDKWIKINPKIVGVQDHVIQIDESKFIKQKTTGETQVILLNLKYG